MNKNLKKYEAAEAKVRAIVAELESIPPSERQGEWYSARRHLLTAVVDLSDATARESAALDHLGRAEAAARGVA